jgi:hypothetical protein
MAGSHGLQEPLERVGIEARREASPKLSRKPIFDSE